MHVAVRHPSDTDPPRQFGTSAATSELAQEGPKSTEAKTVPAAALEKIKKTVMPRPSPLREIFLLNI